MITQINKIIFSVSVVWLIINCSNLCNLWCTLITWAKLRNPLRMAMDLKRVGVKIC